MATSSSRRLSPLPITHSRPVTPKLFQPTTRELRVQDSQEQCIPPPSPVDTDTDAPLSYSRSVTPFKPSTPTMATLSPLASPVTPTHGRHDPAQSTSILPAASPGRAKSGRRRSLWWNGTTDREKEIARVKELVRRTSMPAKSDVSDSAEEFSEFETEERDTGPGEGLTESKTTHEECAMAGGVVEPKSCAQLAVPGNRRNSSTNMKSLLEDGSAAHSSPQGRPQTPRVAAGHAKRLSPIPPGRRQPSVASTGNSLPTAVIETSSVPPAAEPPPLAAALHLEPLASQSNAVSAARERRRREMKAHTTTHPLAHVEEVSTLLGAEMDGGKRSGRSGDNSEIVVAEAEAKLAVVREVQAAHKTQAVAVDCTTDSPKYLEIISAIKEFLTAHGLSRTVQTLSGEVANTSLQNLAVTQPETRSVRDNLRDLLSLRHFVAAWNLVRPFADELRSKRLITVTDARLLESLDDLLFVLSKFQFMTLMESSEFRRANDLLCSVMRNYVSQEMAKGAEKGSFVGQDFRWLEEYHRHRSQITPFPSVPPTGNPYFFWNWESALSAFWISPPASTHPFAFYNHHLVLNSHFGIDSAVRTTKTGLAEMPLRPLDSDAKFFAQWKK
ncbi:hypothetical protein DFJ73DRAFT_547025 [Zopfochytrium polystomum]|nr:hypothetical protein DFJ73DRAFT_547025 [Zopfochytrium polystomum]